ncbi:amidase domain-containing protein [Bacillus cereus]|uniref:amidase domain-containing protein n=1 Tax=Bacillus thuringiensis TaxID=1428 RepID=UPI001F0E86E9|nr:amidase domain-containing protein [Bacillus thuringiensis]MCU5242928.1 amidase domain-containing protein [Bacillus cereus]
MWQLQHWNDGKDCTNFVSQAVNANGNRVVLKTSHTWTVVENFYTYWSSRVPTYETYSLKALEGNVGDVI